VEAKDIQLQQIVDVFAKSDNFIIAGHIGPDSDTIGSCFGLALAFAKLGKTVSVILEPFASKYKIIPGREHLFQGNIDTANADVFIAVDCADVARLGCALHVHKRTKTTVCIDHHETNKGFADINFVDPVASSTAEMVFEIIEALVEIDKDIATAIYAGLVGDTGGFRYVSTSNSTMSIAAKLMDIGIPFSDIYSEMLHRHSFAAAKAFGLTLSVSDTAMGGRIVYSYMTREMLENVSANSSDMDSVVEYLMNTRGADVALFFYEKFQNSDDESTQLKEANDTINVNTENNITKTNSADVIVSTENEMIYTKNSLIQRQIKISMRSRDVHVGLIAASLGGGGHKLAAGCTIIGTLADVINQMLEVVAQALESDN